MRNRQYDERMASSSHKSKLNLRKLRAARGCNPLTAGSALKARVPTVSFNAKSFSRQPQLSSKAARDFDSRQGFNSVAGVPIPPGDLASREDHRSMTSFMDRPELLT